MKEQLNEALVHLRAINSELERLLAGNAGMPETLHQPPEQNHGCVDASGEGAGRPAPEPCPRGADKPEPSCTNRHQCWEPCGELGNDERHVRVSRIDPAEVKRIVATPMDGFGEGVERG